MGAGASSAVLREEKQRPVDASDIQDGDWVSAKQEIVRLRLLLAQLDPQPDSSSPTNKASRGVPMHRSMSATDPDSPKGRRHDSAAAGESAEGRALWSQGTENKGPSRLVHAHSTPATIECEDDGSFDSLDPKSSDESRLVRSMGRVNSARASPATNPHHRRPSITDASTDPDSKSSDESAEGRAVWSQSTTGSTTFDDGAIVYEKSRAAQDLLDAIRTKLFARYDSLRASFLKMDVDRSGYISEDEFRTCMANMGLHMTDDEAELLQQSYPHKEAAGEIDRGMGYLEFVNVMTDQLQYIPGSGEDEESGNYFRLTTAGTAYRPHGLNEDDRPIRQHSSPMANADVIWMQKKIHRQVFGLFTSMKDAFKAADRDGSGYIELPEFVRLVQDTLDMADIDNGQARELLHKFDTNGDGKLAYSEFVKCLHVPH
ncbi:hypothetical protein H310_09360 [Aphanomyces invadans]|uniref:EF-hand domain-containing protein n=1 Tax=Aphanomyces invadans TaxID=157072 RepID=A0A024TVL6_9STRA|nr:hypothetical protein H310_09360 [Aphanomyces invadans]ETV98073.1 hypothetical protein H310_09360 [Aphanomyces invadans]|eukprot:XP_008873634.1 hypothetical protein H310_09360 [Aphanomyces invadans]